MDILYLSHCVPNPPDKGEKIRAHQEVLYLSGRYRVHLVCFARSAADVEAARALEGRCASVYAELLSFPRALLRGGWEFLLGRCLTTAFYHSPGLARRVRELEADGRLAASVAYSSAMAPYAPASIPLLLDMVDVDSQKWLDYGRSRRPGALYRVEGGRLRRVEREQAARAGRTILATAPERDLLGGFAAGVKPVAIENGVDFGYFDPGRTAAADGPKRRYVALVGAMDYYPNAQGAVWFATRVLPGLRREDPEMEFWIVGRNPSRAVRALGRLAGVTVTGGVPDVRPYLRDAVAAVAPLAIARGIQNKVLEALAMGKPVLASPAVCATFGERMPAGVVACAGPADYAAALAGPAADAGAIRAAAMDRFCWEGNLEALDGELRAVAQRFRTAGAGA